MEKRQLLAIMFTDIVGYTAMMGESEPRAVETLRKSRELHRTLIATHSGDYLQEVGDGTLASFASAVDAVGCALELQQAAGQDPDLNLRIGIHSGDVILKGGDIVGDAVNVASRLEPLAATGGICVSGGVYESVRNKPGVGGVYLGAKSLKNVSEPVRVYGLTGEGLPSETEIRKAAEKTPSLKTAGFSPKMKLAAAVLVFAAVAGIWFGVQRGRAPVETAPPEKMALPLPDEPSIAVLPFDNMSGDPSQEYFSDGLTEDIITGLSKVPGLFVIARNSSFTYKGKPVKVQQVSEELGVRYVLEGSVRRSGDKVRITTQLVDALSGRHLWAEKYDRDLNDIFALMDEITMEIMRALEINVTAKEWADWHRGTGTDNLEAYVKFLQAIDLNHTMNLESNQKARHFLEEAIALDPEFAYAYSLLANTYMRDLFLGATTDRRKTWTTGMELAKKAIIFDENYAPPYTVVAFLLLHARKYDEAIAAAERAVALDPANPELFAIKGLILEYAGRNEEAAALFDKARRLDPFPSSFTLLWAGSAYRAVGRLDDAIRVCRASVEQQKDFFFGYLCLASVYTFAGHEEEAQAAAAEVLRINPGFTVEGLGTTLPYKNPEDLAELQTGLRKAGLPE